MISAVILTKNEENNIKECIKSLGFCDEIIVIDDNSIDKTVPLAKKLGAKVHSRDMNMDYSAQSNFGASIAQNKWILFTDADERVSDKLSKEIVDTIEKNEHVKGYYFKRIDYMWGKWLKHGESGNSYVLRLVRKGAGEWKRRVHPTFEIQGTIATFQNPILHYPHRSVAKFIQSIDRWSSWHSIANYEEAKKASVLKIVFWPISHFTKNYFLRLGFLDGIQGFVFACLMSFHSFLAWSKLWVLQKGLTKR